MSSLEQGIPKRGAVVHETSPILAARFIVRYTKRALTLLMSAALVLADIPEFGLQADASMAPATTKGSPAKDTTEVA
jgi:hypothetical protein